MIIIEGTTIHPTTCEQSSLKWWYSRCPLDKSHKYNLAEEMKCSQAFKIVQSITDSISDRVISRTFPVKA